MKIVFCGTRPFILFAPDGAAGSTNSTSESGHIINCNNSKELIEKVKLLPNYAPSKIEIQIPNLETKHTNCVTVTQNAITSHNTRRTIYGIRIVDFEGLVPLTVRVANTYYGSDATEANKNVVRTIMRNLEHYSLKKARTPEEEIKMISTSKQSYNRQKGYLRELIDFLKTDEANYIPSAADIQITALETKLAVIRTDCVNCDKKDTEDAETIRLRDIELYDENTGLLNYMHMAKNIVRGEYGSKDPRFIDINAIEFVNLKNK